MNSNSNEIHPSTSGGVVVGNLEEGKRGMNPQSSIIKYSLTFSDNSQLELKPNYSKFFGMVEDFGKAMASKSLKAEIPMPKPFTKEAIEIVLGYFDLLSNNNLKDPEASEYFSGIPVNLLIAALNTAEFMICESSFIKICSLHIARKLKGKELPDLYDACSFKDMKKSLEKFRSSPSCWILFGETMKEIYGKEPNWEKCDEDASAATPPPPSTTETL